MRELEIGDLAGSKGFITDGDWVVSKDMNPNGSVRLIQLADIGAGKFLDKTSKYITEEKLQELKGTVVNKGDILMARMADPIGRSCLFPGSENLSIVAVDITILRIGMEGVDERYLNYIFNSKQFQRQVESLARGTTRIRITRKNLEKIQIPLPPLPIQRRIAAILDQADALRRKDAALLARYDALAQSVFLELFTNLEGEPVSLSKLCKVNPRKSEITDYDRSILVSFVPMANVSEQGHLTLEEERTIDDVWSGYTYFKEDDVVFAKITPCMENGKGAIMRGLKNGLGFGTTEFHVLRPIPGKSNSEWLYYLTASNKFREIASVNMTGSAGQKRVPTTFFDKFKLVPPPIELQNEFAMRVKLIEQQIALVKENLVKSEDLFQSLLQKAFKGELVSAETLNEIS